MPINSPASREAAGSGVRQPLRRLTVLLMYSTRDLK